jgi:ATP-dependent exoDNAse (exonuclease V) beta subunit
MSTRDDVDRSDRSDHAARQRALDVSDSFIVQAPAGSGKTELLIQRYLALLAGVEAPEEVIAITFTRKAAAEMRSRVLAALATGSDETQPEAPHEQVTWRLARAARARDLAQGWELAANPNRLRIDTIDALCHALARQMPVLSRFGARPETVTDARPLYEEAARRTLGLLDADGDAGAQVARLLSHLDNNVAVTIDLISGMLAKRDQWIRHVAERMPPHERRAQLEAALANEVAQALVRLVTLTPAALRDGLAALLRYACGNLSAAGMSSPILACDGLAALPDALADDLDAWRGIAELLLTKEGSLRKVVNKNQGFPPGKGAASDAKDRHAAMMAALDTHAAFVAALHFTRALPPATYSEAQWRVVEALTALLPLAAANLELIFGERGQADFTAVSQAALRALGENDAPTDLALALDYRIRHLLVDEFQDTSLSQYELLARLTAGWQPDDGRTLFVVGDPMQSIYRFREAEVGLYLRARHEGIGSVPLTPLTLSVNFRSQRGVVDWVNRAFEAVMPRAEDLASGAVPYVSSQARDETDESDDAVHVHALGSMDRAAEAQRVVEIVQWERSENSNKNIVLLVRARGHLAAIAQALRDAALSFQAVEIEALGQRPVVQDLTALTRALFHPADRIAWLAILRAPWCGLTLADLQALAGDDHRAALWRLMQDDARVQTLSADGASRLTRVRGLLADFIAGRRRVSAARWIEGAWLALGGPACVADRVGLEDAQAYFRLLETLEESGDILDFSALEQSVAKLFAAPDAQADARLQLMTIHKAKGLEFDVVIVPGLGYAPRRNEAQLLAWQERPRAHGESELLLAPIREASEEADPIYKYLDALEKLKAEHEDARLLYVAATRAKSRLHLVGQIDAAADKPGPRGGSLLARLWPAVAGDFAGVAAPQSVDVPAAEAPAPLHLIQRLPLNWLPPPPPARVELALPMQDAARSGSPEDVEFSWASETAKHVGTVVHRFLQRIAEAGLASWDAARVNALQPAFQRELKRLGVPEAEMQPAVERVATALAASLSDTRGCWLLQAHEDARAELRLTGIVEGEVVDVIIDRTFVDEHGVRWIVDFKTSVHEGADRDAFLDNERVRYAAQLQRYGALMRMAEAREICLGLYFPLLGGWREWRFDA